MKLTKWLAPMLALALLAGCGAEAVTPTAEDETVTNEGITLTVPAEYAALLVVETPEGDERGTLFTLSEAASIEAAAATGYTDGAGRLVDIRRITKQEAVDNMVYDIPGETLFARDEAGWYYVADFPTDVRLIREDNEAMTAAMDQWSALNQWSATVPQLILGDNSALLRYSADELRIEAGDLMTDPDRYTSFTNAPAPEVDAFAQMVKDLYLAEDWENLAMALEYPVRVNPYGLLEDEDAFLSCMEGRHISESSREELLAENCRNLAVTGEGAFLAGGQLWLRDSGYDVITGEGEPHLAVFAINGVE